MEIWGCPFLPLDGASCEKPFDLHLEGRHHVLYCWTSQKFQVQPLAHVRCSVGTFSRDDRGSVGAGNEPFQMGPRPGLLRCLQRVSTGMCVCFV